MQSSVVGRAFQIIPKVLSAKMAPPVFPTLAGIITARDSQSLRCSRPPRVPNTLPIPSAPFLSLSTSLPLPLPPLPPSTSSFPLLPSTARTRCRVQVLWFLSPSSALLSSRVSAKSTPGRQLCLAHARVTPNLRPRSNQARSIPA